MLLKLKFLETLTLQNGNKTFLCAQLMCLQASLMTEKESNIYEHQKMKTFFPFNLTEPLCIPNSHFRENFENRFFTKHTSSWKPIPGEYLTRSHKRNDPHDCFTIAS